MQLYLASGVIMSSIIPDSKHWTLQSGNKYIPTIYITGVALKQTLIMNTGLHFLFHCQSS